MKLGFVAVAVLLTVPAVAQAGQRDEIIDQLVKCADLSDSAARLACFDRNTPALRAAAKAAPSAPMVAAQPPIPPKPAAAPPPPPPVPAEPPKAVALAAPPPVATAPAPKPEGEAAKSGGSWLSDLNPFSGVGTVPKPTAKQMAFQPIGEEILPVTIGVKEFYVPYGGAFMVTLANNQVWRAVHGYSSPPRFHDGKTNLVVIDHAMLGGYNLSLYGHSTFYKVERVQ